MMQTDNQRDEPTRSKKNQHGPSQRANYDIDLIDVLRTYFLPYWKGYCAAIFLGAVLAVGVSFLFRPRYAAENLSLVNTGSATSSLSGGMGGLRGLASLAGVNLNSTDSDAVFNINYVDSRELADAFIEKYGLRRDLFPGDYNEQGLYLGDGGSERAYERLLGRTHGDIEDDDIYLAPGPTKEQVYKKFRKVFSVNVDQKDLTVSVAVTWVDPLVAKRWANDYVQLANDILRQKAIEEARRRIEYLEARVRERPEIEVQQAVYALIESEMKRIAVAEASDQYGFKVLQRAYLPERKISPKRLNYLLGGALAGFAMALLAVLLLRFGRMRRVWRE